MSITVTPIIQAPAVLNAITLGAGGSLVVGTTYYYRIIAIQSWQGRVVMSAASAEQSVTPTTGNQTAQLSWSAVSGATAYILQRSTTSGSYPVEGANTFNLNGQSYAGYPFARVGTSQNDDGGAVSNVRFDSANLDFDTEFPGIDVYASADTEVITLYDIAAALIAAGRSDLALAGTTALQAGTNWRSEGLYLLRGVLRISVCTFQMRGPLLGIPGVMKIEATTIINIGHATTNYLPLFVMLGLGRIAYTNNGNTYLGTYVGGNQIYGKSDATNICRYYIERTLNYSAVGNYASRTADRTMLSGDYRNIDLINSIISPAGMTVASYYTPTVNSKNDIFEGGFYAYGSPLVTPSFRGMVGIDLNVFYNVIVDTPYFYEMTKDISIPWFATQRGVIIIDPKFMALGQTDNQPYLTGYRFASDNLATLCMATRVTAKVTNGATGALIGSGTVTALNANGLSAFFKDSLTTITATLTRVGTTVTVVDSSKLTVGKYYRVETMGEVWKVTATPTGTTATIERGKLGTPARYSYGLSGSRKILEMVDSLSVDGSGNVTPEQPVLQRELFSINSTGNQTDYEGTVVANGYMARNFFGPYALTVTVPGYQTYVAQLLDPVANKYPLGPINIEVAMKRIEEPPGPWEYAND